MAPYHGIFKFLKYQSLSALNTLSSQSNTRSPMIINVALIVFPLSGLILSGMVGKAPELIVSLPLLSYDYINWREI